MALFLTLSAQVILSPIPKCDAFGKTLPVNDFRGISIRLVISKLFEHCILDRFSTFLALSDHQFGFKKGSSCSHAIHTVKTAVDYYNKGGSTVNLCDLDLSKAFDKMDHNVLFVKLVERKLPVEFYVSLKTGSIVNYMRSLGFHNYLLQIISRRAPRRRSASLPICYFHRQCYQQNHLLWQRLPSYF